MPASHEWFKNILVAVDFSASTPTTLNQALRLAKTDQCRVALAHCVPDIARLIASTPRFIAGMPQLATLYGDIDQTQQDFKQDAAAQLSELTATLPTKDHEISSSVLVGDPDVAISQAVAEHGYDLVVCGTRGAGTWEKFLVGSTAKRLVRDCPTSVLVVNDEHRRPPQVVMAAVDFSAVSLKALSTASSVATHWSAELHVLHVVESLEISAEAVKRNSQAERLRNEINDEAAERILASVKRCGGELGKVRVHVSWGTPWRELARTAERINAELIAIGTVGRSGINGLLIGNTAEKVLSACRRSILTVKPDDFRRSLVEA
ncbi:universal stress protein [Lacipirellula limnantheis]|uniref:UspA domain-containing protein n=1 Tax=Lacipirellula limnantheis TaxID=2528024 RepID=A0A517TYP8_9BACT|nr:universal stress protein [Lacipirellula limnantheis]QDT73499.1 hypothetical protein I41_26880 [Lacipirellula limnantheis]